MQAIAQRIGSTDKRLLLAVLSILALAIAFWSGSRYPALNEKAMMGSQTDITALGFDTILPTVPDASTVRQVYVTAVNWAYTNRQGMLFGVLFGALMMTILPWLRRLQVKSSAGQSALGVVAGSPLGVCVNCATPVAHGMYAAGARLEMMLSALVSSPTLNIIVLTMMFSMFPWYMAAIKIGLTLCFIFGAIPFIARWAGTTSVPWLLDRPSSLQTMTEMQLSEDQAPSGASDSWLGAASWVLGTFLRNLWFIIKTAVPLMILAGVLGAIAVTVLPLFAVADVFPGGNRTMVLATIVLIATFGLFLPVPMAFDVIVTAVLWQAGLPEKYAMVLLFTLGIFSIYPFMMIWKDISRRVAMLVAGALIGFGILAGVIGHFASIAYFQEQHHVFASTMMEASDGPRFDLVEAGQQLEPQGQLVSELRQLARSAAVTYTAPGIQVQQVPFNAPSEGSGSSSWFTQHDGKSVGLNESDNFSVFRIIPPFSARSIATGDVHNDGWPDVLLSSDNGLALYANRGGQSFVRQPLDIPELESFFIASGAFVDLNNDGWQDLYFTTHRRGNFVVYNDGGQYLEQNLTRLPTLPETIMAFASSFGDVDGNGELDIVQGNMSVLEISPLNISFDASRPAARNTLVLQQDGQFEAKALSKFAGESWTVLLSDFTGDHQLDLMVGNDIGPPDLYYRGEGNGQFGRIASHDALIPHSTWTTMSMATADINNDLTPEIFAVQTDALQNAEFLDPQATCVEFAGTRQQEQCEAMYGAYEAMRRAFLTKDVRQCLRSDAGELSTDCVAVSLLQKAIAEKNPALCDLFPASWDEFAFVCRESFKPANEFSTAENDEMIPQIMMPPRNVLLVADHEGQFHDRTEQYGLEGGGFAWNTKFADIDNDGWQDVYFANGYLAMSTRETNRFFRNEQGQGFSDQTESSGLHSLMDTYTYAYVDWDQDGDLDIIMVPAVGAIRLYENTLAQSNAIVIELRDELGNRFGVGSRVEIRYGNNLAQMRELQLGGGFLAFEAPLAHFGLGDADRIHSLTVHWSTGEVTTINEPLAAGARYTIHRRSSSLELAHATEGVARSDAPAN